MDPRLVQIDYSTISKFWLEHLWARNPENIRPISTMLFDGGYSICIKQKYQPVLWGFFQGEDLQGVVSGHFCSEMEFRVRGLCVKPDRRGNGIGKALLMQAIEYGKLAGATLIWSYPRLSAMGTYAAVGFVSQDRKLNPADKNCYAYLKS